MKIISPHFVLGGITTEKHFRCAAVAAIVNQYAITAGCNVLRQCSDRGHRPAAAGRQRDPGAAVADDFVLEACAVDLGSHGGRYYAKNQRPRQEIK